MDTNEVIEVLEEGPSWFSNPLVALAIGGVIGAAAGTLISARVYKAKYERIADEEIQSVKEHYALTRKDGALLEQMAEQYREDEVVPEEPATVVSETHRVESVTVVERSVFGGELTEFDHEQEVLLREQNPTDPHVITKDEFDANESNYNQDTLTWYDGDNTLADGKDDPIIDVDGTIGESNLKFGYGSGDRNVVYIRCPRLEMDFEIVMSQGKFAVEVLGFNDEDSLQHSDRRGRRFRSED